MRIKPSPRYDALRAMREREFASSERKRPTKPDLEKSISTIKKTKAKKAKRASRR